MAKSKEDLMDNAEAEANTKVINTTETDPQHEKRIAWWRDARFGLFIHWGLYSMLAGEWDGKEVEATYGEHIQLRGKIPVKEYEKVAERFNPIHFNAKQWVRTAKNAGMKYIVVTAKHHDGFAMYDSKVCDYNIMKRTPFGRDPMAELAQACAEEGIKLCFYYSHAMDWHHPDSQGNTLDYPNNIGAWDPLESWIDDEDKKTRFERYLEEKAFPQLRELLTQYGPVGIIWFDCGHKITDEQGQKFVDFVHCLQPGCLVNQRVRREGFGDYGNSGDNQLHIRVPRQDWESIATLNDSWGYREADQNWKSPADIVRHMIDVVSMGGNYLLNVGPDGTGAIDPKSLGILQEIGEWMTINGESIYGTIGSPIGKQPWGRCTLNDKNNKLYLHLFDRPASGELLIPGLRSQVKQVYGLQDEARTNLSFTRLNEEDVMVYLPQTVNDSSLPEVIVVEYEKTLQANPARLLFRKDYPNIFEAFDGEIHGNKLRYDTGKKGKNNLMNWSSMNDWVSWDFRADAPGVYGVEVAYGSELTSAGGIYTVSVEETGPNSEGEAVQAFVSFTGGAYQVQSFAIGKLKVRKPGYYTLKVTAENIEGNHLMNLNHIRLTYLEKE